MTKHLVSRTLLGAAGGLLTVIGISILADPQGFAAANLITLPIDASLLSELRAPSGLLVGSGVFMLISAARQQQLLAGLTLASAVYGSYGLSRLIGLMADGIPSKPLVQAMGIELLMGAACLIAAIRLHGANQEKSVPITL